LVAGRLISGDGDLEKARYGWGEARVLGVAVEVVCCCAEERGGIAKETKPSVALVAEEVSKASGLVVMIDSERTCLPVTPISHCCLWLTTNGAEVELLDDDMIVGFRGDPKLPPTPLHPPPALRLASR
jgi:hypothetical protein